MKNNEIAVKDIFGVSSATSVNVAVHFEIMKQELMAIYEKNATDGYKIIVAPQEKMADAALSIAEAMKEVESFLNQFKPGFNFDGVTNSIGSIGENITLGLKAAFLYVDKEAQNEAVVDYAFGVKVACKDFKILPGVKLESVSVSFWNTERKKVKELLGLESIEDILNKYS